MQGQVKDRYPRGNGIEMRAEKVDGSNITSTKEYIARLEAEIESLKGGSGNVSSSRPLSVSQSPMHRREDSSGGAMRIVIFIPMNHEFQVLTCYMNILSAVHSIVAFDNYRLRFHLSIVLMSFLRWVTKWERLKEELLCA